eukprot:gene50213-10420_t
MLLRSLLRVNGTAVRSTDAVVAVEGGSSVTLHFRSLCARDPVLTAGAYGNAYGKLSAATARGVTTLSRLTPVSAQEGTPQRKEKDAAPPPPADPATRKGAHTDEHKRRRQALADQISAAREEQLKLHEMFEQEKKSGCKDWQRIGEYEEGIDKQCAK